MSSWTDKSVVRRSAQTRTTEVLYSSIRRNSDQPESAMDRERCLLRIMPRPDRSSGRDDRPGFRQARGRPVQGVRAPTPDPPMQPSQTGSRLAPVARRCLRLCSRCRWREPRGACAKGFGDSSKLLSESTAEDWRPRSIPATGPSTGCGSSRSTSTARDPCQRSASRLTVAERMRARNFSALSLVCTQPSRGSVTERRPTLMLPMSRKVPNGRNRCRTARLSRPWCGRRAARAAGAPTAVRRREWVAWGRGPLASPGPLPPRRQRFTVAAGPSTPSPRLGGATGRHRPTGPGSPAPPSRGVR